MTVTRRRGGIALGPSNSAAAPRALLLIAVAVILRPIVIGFDPLGNFNFKQEVLKIYYEFLRQYDS